MLTTIMLKKMLTNTFQCYIITQNGNKKTTIERPEYFAIR